MVDVTILDAEIHVWPVVVAGVGGWMVGSVWYTIFAKPWMALAYPGKKRSQVTTSYFGYFAALVAYIIIAAVLAMVLVYYNQTGVGEGLKIALLTWFGFVATTFCMNYAFGGRPAKLYLIDVGNYLLSFLAIGAIVGGWQ